MNPSENIAPRGSNNEILRRIANRFYDANGNPKPGSPGGPTLAKTIGTPLRHAATNPAYLLVPADDNRVGGLLRNLDASDPILYGSNSSMTDGGTLLAGETLPLNVRGNIYIFSASGSPIAEFVPILST